MLISDFCYNALAFRNELMVLNEESTPETFDAMLSAVLEKRGLEKTLAHLKRG
jgi:hypothetical protein